MSVSRIPSGMSEVEAFSFLRMSRVASVVCVPGEVLERKLSSGEGSDESRDNGGFGSFGSRTEGDRGEFVFFAHPQVGIDDGGDKEFAVATVVARKVGADVSPLVRKAGDKHRRAG